MPSARATCGEQKNSDKKKSVIKKGAKVALRKDDILMTLL
jgi:hypothetical protein